MAGPAYALNLFNVVDRAEYLAYSRRSAKEVEAHGGRVVALGRFQEAVAGDIKPRTVMIVVEWKSKVGLRRLLQRSKNCRSTSAPGEGTCDYIWHLFDKLEDLRSILK
jgi:uncharacterized protein (DUF1330 family)